MRLEDHDRRFLRQCARHHYTLAFTVAQFADKSTCDVRDARGVEGVLERPRSIWTKTPGSAASVVSTTRPRTVVWAAAG